MPIRDSLIPMLVRSFAKNASVTSKLIRYSHVHWLTYAILEREYIGEVKSGVLFIVFILFVDFVLLL